MLIRENPEPQAQPRLRISLTRLTHSTSRFSDDRQRVSRALRAVPAAPSNPSVSEDSDFAALIRSAFFGLRDDSADVVPAGQRFPNADLLRPYIGKWVAVRVGVVVFAADNASEIVARLRSTG